MQRLTAVDPAAADPKARQLLDGVAKALGMTPNMFKTMAASPALLDAYVGFNKALSAGKLSPKVREQIALTLAGANGCDYCASAHTLLGKHAGVAAEDLLAGLRGHAHDPKVEAALQFAQAVNRTKGQVSDDEIARIRAAGYDDGEIAEIVGHVALNVLTNSFNNVAATEIDFPVVHAKTAA